MAVVSVLEIEENYGPNDTNRGNQMMAVAGEALLGYIKQESPEHTVFNMQQKVIPAEEVRKVNAAYEGGDISIDDQAVISMVLEQAKMAGRQGEALVVGMRSVTPFFSHATKLSGKIKEAVSQLRAEEPELSVPEVRIVIGGYHASGMAPAIRKGPDEHKAELKAGDLYIGHKYKKLEGKLRASSPDSKDAELVDAYVVGEGEETFLDLVNYYDRVERGAEGKDIREIPGVVFRREGIVNFTGKRGEMRDTNDKTKEDYPKLTLPEPYRKLTLPLMKKDSEGRSVGLMEVPSSAGCTQVGSFPGDEDIHGEIGIGASRGCAHRCEFCSSGDVWCAVRYRDAVSVVKEAAKYWKDPAFRTNFIYFFDLTFNAQYKKHANELCDAMKHAKMLPSGEIVVDAEAEGERIFGTDDVNKIHWFCLSEVFDIPKEGGTDKVDEALTKMADAGCTKIGYGIEGFTPKDIVHIKRLDHSQSEEDILEQGIERFAKTAWVLKRTTEKGIFTRGYFMWGTENQDKTSFDKAMALLTTEIPAKVFEKMEGLKAVIRELFEQQAEGNNEPDIKKLVMERLGYSEEDVEEKARLLEIDHLRVAYETPYPNTDVARDPNRKLRYFEYYRDEDGFFLHDAKGKLIPKLFTDKDEELEIVRNGEHVLYQLNGEVMPTGRLEQCHKRVDKTWEGYTLDAAKSEGWDDWELLTQEVPILESDVPIEDMERHQGEFIQRFYSSESYRRSMEHRAETQPRNAEAIYAWQKFWNDRLGRDFDFLSDEKKAEAEERYRERLESLELGGDERREWIDKHFMDARKPVDETMVELSGERRLS